MQFIIKYLSHIFSQIHSGPSKYQLYNISSEDILIVEMYLILK